MKKEEILAKAKEIISNDRNVSHGDAFKNHAEIAEFWNIFLDNKLRPMANITADDVAIMMILLKISSAVILAIGRNLLSRNILRPMANITADDVAIMMILLKISRHTQGEKFNLDNFIDMAGYSAIAGEIGNSGSF